MISVRSEVRFNAIFKHFTPATAAAMVGLASLAFAAGPVAAADPPAANSGGTAQVAQVPPNPAYNPGVYNSPVYGAPVYTTGYQPYTYYNSPFYDAPVTPVAPVATQPVLSPVDVLISAFYNAPVYNAPWGGGGWYFGPSGSLSVLRDSDLIKRFEPRTSDTFLSIPRSITGDSTSWLRSSGTGGTSSWAGTSSPWLLSTEGGSRTRQLTSSIGYDVGARAGYQWGNFRSEFQFDYANNSVDTFTNPNRISDFVMRDRVVSGSTTGMSFLVNGFLDLNVPYLNGYGATPYFGGGIGGGQTSLDLKVGDRTIVNSSDWGVAYQLGAGLRWQINPTVSLDLGYRFRGISDVTLHNQFERINVPNSSHNFEVSLLWQLPWGAAAYPPALAPPPYTPAPPPPPPPPR